MAKNIVIFSDGTGNTTIKGRGTNVFKLFEAVDLNGHRSQPHLPPQIAIYDDGVGTEDFKPLKLLGGAVGLGIARNVRQLYKGLVRIYERDDRIFLFGFSRGAFTVRTLAGMIAICGILDSSALTTTKDLNKAVRDTYGLLRQCFCAAWERLFRTKDFKQAEKEFRKKYKTFTGVNIEFLGVWDTVDAVGGPLHISDVINTLIYRFKFPDLDLSDAVRRGCHALSIDDERHAFHPVLWNARKGVEQVWFAGVHSNVGGGYPKQGMSIVALDWMMQKAEESGLRILPSDRQRVREHADIDDKLYDSRAGAGIFYRWLPRPIDRLCGLRNVKPVLHLSVLERIARGTGGYAPGNLPPSAEVTFTSMGDPAQDASLQSRCARVQSVLDAAVSETLLSRVRPAVWTGRVSYYLFVTSFLATLLAASAQGPHSWTDLRADLWEAGKLAVDIFTLQWSGIQEKVIWLFTSILGWGLSGAVAVSYLLGVLADRRMSREFSGFWHNQRALLRNALRRSPPPMSPDALH
jgi:hypothetical protein